MEKQVIHPLIACPSRRAPQFTDDFFLSWKHLKASSLFDETPEVHFPIVDPERPLHTLDNFDHGFMDFFEGTVITVILQDRI